MRYHILSLQERNEEFARTGQGVDYAREIRPDIERCIDSDPVWYEAKRKTSFLEKRWWDDERVLLHAAALFFVAPHMCVRGGLTREITKDEFMTWLDNYCQRRGLTFSPTWTPFDADTCPGCNKPLPPYEFGRPRGHCSDACKMKAYRQRKKALRKSEE